MLVSGKNVIAIDGVKTGNTLKGDGVFNTPGSKLDVNTDIIATKEFVTAEDEKVVGKINAASATLSNKIDSVSSKLTTSAETLSANKQDKLEFAGDHNRITAIGPSGGTLSSVGGNVVDVKAGNSTVVTTATDEETGITTYTVSLTAQPTDTIVSGENGISSRQTANTFYVGLSSTYENAIKKVSSISADVTALSSNKLDKTAFDPSKFYPMTGNPSGFLIQQSLNNYYNKTEVDNKFTSTSSWANNTFLTENSANTLYQPKGNYLSSNALNDLSGNWQTTYTQVNASSQYWNNAYDTISSISALKDIGNFKEIDVYKDGVQEPLRIIANGSADKLELKEVANINFITDPIDGSIRVSAKDTTYSQGQYIKISGETNEINVTGLQPAGNYVSSTEFETYKTSAQTELNKKQDKSAMSAYAESAWVVQNFLPIDALDDLSGKWESASNIVYSHSANWDSVYESVNETSGDWNKVSAKLNKADFDEWSATIDTAFYSAGEGLALDNHTFSISAKYLSANALDDLSGKWEDAADNLNSNSAKWNSVYDTVETNSADWQKVVNSAEKWNTMYDEYTDNSAVWNDTTNTVDSYSAIWNEVSAKANSSDLNELSGKVETLSGELETASAFIEGQINYLSGAIDDNSDDIDYLSGAIDDKLDKDDFDAWSANADITPYTAGEGLALDDHQFYVSAKYVTSAGDSLSGKMLVLKDNKWEEMPDFGGFTTAAGTGADYHPDVNVPSNKLIYLVKEKNLPPSSDNYKEWIYTLTETPQWECIGETTLDLTPYQLKLSAGDYISISGETNVISVTGLHNTSLTSTNGSIGITATTAANGDVEYDLGVRTIPSISGINGVSAYYDETDDQYVVGLDDYNDIGFATFRSETNTFTTSSTVTGYIQTLNVNPTKIALTNDQILLNKGFYHIDLQLDLNIDTPENFYYDVLVKSIPGAASITQMIDASYEHSETIDLSFDIRITSDDTPLEISIENFKTNETFGITNLNIHEIVSMPSKINGGVGDYQAGEAIDITNSIINVKYESTSGIALDPISNKLYIKLGEGLKFDTSGAAAGSLSLSNIAQDVIDTVETIAHDLDEKVTSNFPPAMISKTDCDIAAYRNAGSMYGNLFNVSINSVIEVDRTQLGFYIYQVDHDKNVIFGLYEYQPDYPRYNYNNPESGISGYGRTVPLCDTGVITIPAGTTGFCEYPIKNLNNTISGDNPETRPALKSSCMYYATIFLGSDMSEGGLCLAGVPNGYAPQFNQIKPGLNVYQDNFNLQLNDAAYSARISFNDFGFGWKYTNYPNHYNSGDTTSAELSYQEKAEGHRFYMQIRNKPKTSN